MRKKMMGGGMMKPMYKDGGSIEDKIRKIGLEVKANPLPKKTKNLLGKLKKSYSKRPGKKMGGSLKSVPAGNKGLKKLPTEVRNKMGFMKKGGPVAPAPKKDYKLGTKFQGDYKGKSLPGKVKEFVKTGVKQTVGTAKKIARKFKGDK